MFDRRMLSRENKEKIIEIFIDDENKEKTIGGSWIRVDWLIEKLKENVQELREKFEKEKLGKVTIKIIPEIQGFGSKIYFIDFTFTEDMNDVFKVVMKTSLSLEDKINVHFTTKECNFYRGFSSTIPVPIPKIFFTQPPDPHHDIPSVILMENLSDRGVTVGYDDYITEEQAKNVVENIAELHAYIWSLDDDSWQENFIQKDTLNPSEWLKKLLTDTMNLVPGVFEAHIKRLSRFINKAEGLVYDKFVCCEELGIPLVLVHNDLWQNNIIWKKNRDESASDQVLAFIDWQNCIICNPMKDLARHLVLCLDGRLRKHVETYIIEFYYQKLHEFCTKPEKLEGITVEKLKKAYAYSFAKQSIIGCTFIGMRVDPGPDAPIEKQQEFKDLMAKIVQNVKWALEDA